MSWLLQNFDWPAGDFKLRLRFLSETIFKDLSSDGIAISHKWGGLHLEGLSPVVVHVIKEMASRWIEKDELWTLAVGEKRAESNVVYFSELVSVLSRLEFLCQLQLVLNKNVIATIEPLPPNSVMVFRNDAVDSPRLSRFTYLQRNEFGFAMESAVGVHRIILQNDWTINLAAHIARGSKVTSFIEEHPNYEQDTVYTFIELLDATGMLEGRELNKSMGIGDDLMRFGEFHDLLFHRHSRFGHHDRPFGATFPFLKDFPPLPAVPAPLSKQVVLLPIPSESGVLSRDIKLVQALETRVSVRQYDADPLTIAQLGEFLFRCARIRVKYGPAPEFGMPYEVSDRPYPTGGGIFDLELYLVVNDIVDLPRGIYHYAAERHVLEPLNSEEEDTADILQAAMRASGTLGPPQVLITLASRFGRMSWKYRSISYATTLKNVGVLYQTMYLVATAMGIGACALGSGNDLAAHKAMGLADRSEIPVGEFMIGSLLKGNGSPLGTKAGFANHPTWQPLIAPGWGQS